MLKSSLVFLKKFFGFFILFSTIFLIIALLSFDADDPSFFLNANNNTVKNIAGSLGADLASPIIGGLGISVLIIIIFLLALSIKLLLGIPNKFLFLRLTCLLIIAIPNFSIFISCLEKQKSSRLVSFAGYLGNYLRYQLIGSFDKIIIIVITGFLGVIGSFLCIGVSFLEWRKVFSILCKFFIKIVFILKKVLLMVKKFADKIKVTDEEVVDKKTEITDNNINIEESVVTRNEPRNKKVLDDKGMSEEYKSTLPPFNLLKEVPFLKRNSKNFEDNLVVSTEELSKVLKDFGIRGKISNVNPGPVVTLYELEPAAGTKSSRIIGLSDDIARSMSAISARVAVMPGKNAIGIELPNQSREIVYLRELLESNAYQNSTLKLPLVLGKNIGGEPVITDLAKMPHLLVAGTTGSGKSVAINTMILSLLYKLTPKECKLVMIDPKMLELSVYEGIPHLLSPVVTEPRKAIGALKWVVEEMEKRYRMMSMLGVRNIVGYNNLIINNAETGKSLERNVQTGFDPATGEPLFEKITISDKPLPYIVVIVDEMADLMLVAGKEIEGYIQRIAQMARAAGIHLIMATQRPSVDVITGVIKANFPTRISFQVTSKIDSRTILGEQGGEQLLGMGDMLFMMTGGKVERVHGPFVGDNEVEKVVAFLKKQGKPEYVQEIIAKQEDASEDIKSLSMQNNEKNSLYEQALSIVLTEKKATTSYLQRKLKIGYNKAASLIEKMEDEGIVSSPNHMGKREILVKKSL